MAGLPASSAMVCVGPPLLCNPAGSSSESVLLSEPFAALKPQLAPSSRLWPLSVIGPAQLWPETLLATMVFWNVARHGSVPALPHVLALPIAPPQLAVPPPILAEKVVLVTLSVPPL